MNPNQAIVDEFRANDGVVGGYFVDMPLLLLHTKGAKSRLERVSPLAMQPVDGGWAVFASKGGADENPAWYHNLRANPETTVEVGSETYPVRAREAKGDEYERIWTKHKADLPQFADYERKTTRESIPVVVLERL
jgi:deazaflavin-dependent oxidoreductase (nitroreductase family)